jgi:hypothetical protein
MKKKTYMHQSNAGCQKQTNKMAYANSQEEQSTDKLVCNVRIFTVMVMIL